MKKTVKIAVVAALCALLALACCYGIKNGQIIIEDDDEEAVEDISEIYDLSSELVIKAENALEKGSYTTLELKEDVTISSSGIYMITGYLNEGQLTIDTSGTVILLLNNVTITNTADACINIVSAKQTLLYTMEGTDNTFTSGEVIEITSHNEEDNEGAAIYSKNDLTLAGEGNLSVYGYINNGIASTDNLLVLSGNINVTALNNGLKGKDNTVIYNGEITIISGNDGIKANNEEAGNIIIENGTLDIHSYGDATDAAGNLTIEDGTITIQTADTTLSEKEHSNEMTEMTPDDFGSFDMSSGFDPASGSANMPVMPSGNTPEMPDMSSVETPQIPSGQMPEAMTTTSDSTDTANGTMPQMSSQAADSTASADETTNSSDNTIQQFTMDKGFGGGFSNSFEGNSAKDDTVSQKGLKAGNVLTINGGTITIASADDAIHSNGDVHITNGTITISSIDDGIHADNDLLIENGEIDILDSYEGIEGYTIEVTGGNITLASSDDGFNASGNSSALAQLTISGGTIYVDADGDGLDSNGNLIVEGGDIIVDGPTNSGNGALDSGTESGGEIVCNGGQIIAIGASGMAEAFGTESEQCFLAWNGSTYQANTEITITDSDNKEIYNVTSAKSFSSIIFSSEALKENGTYTLTIGEDTYEITLDGTSGSYGNTYSEFGSFGGYGQN